MEKSLLFILFLSISIATAQVKIGENPNTLDANSILELESSNRAFVLTRITTVEMDAMTPLQGAMVYNEDESCIFYYDGTTWNNLCSGGMVGNVTWGSLTGTLTDQTDLSAEFENYVDLSTSQTVAGEKTLTEKLTVNTGNVSDQAGEFLGRVKGEDGTAPEDFITKAQLDAVGGGNPTWGSITGTLGSQTDLAAEFQNYVDLTTAQSIAGEKTLTEKFTVNTGNVNDQAGEFFGRVKGEDGTAPEDFVTRLQLDAVAAGGHTGSSGSIFFADNTNQPSENNAQLYWNDANQRLGIGTNLPNSTIQTAGSFATKTAFIGGAFTLTENDHTVFISSDATVNLPPAAAAEGRIYVIKKTPGANVNISNYNDTESVNTTTMIDRVLWIQSNGFNWEQIN